MTQETIANKKNLIVLIGAFAAVYIFWGSTYLAIKYAMDTLPPFLMAGSRFLVAGSILYLVARFSADYERPKPVHWRTSFVVGTLLLLGGNGGVVIATLYIPSSLTALLVATEPFFIIILSWLWLKGGRPGWKASLGLLIGFAGVWLLISGRPAGGVAGTSDTGQWIGIAAVIFGALSWAAGSIYGLKSPVPKSSMQTAAMQMISGSLSLLLVGLIRGEWSRFDPSAVSANSIIGVTYLIIFGSLIGFTAYSWLLKNAEPSMVATYAYVNPVIAVLLGWGIAGESLTAQMLIGAFIVVVSVALITANKKAKNEDGEEIEIHRSQTPSCNQPSFSTSS